MRSGLDLRARPEPRLASPACLARKRPRHQQARGQDCLLLPHRERTLIALSRARREGGNEFVSGHPIQLTHKPPGSGRTSVAGPASEDSGVAGYRMARGRGRRRGRRGARRGLHRAHRLRGRLAHRIGHGNHPPLALRRLQSLFRKRGTTRPKAHRPKLLRDRRLRRLRGTEDIVRRRPP